MIQIKDGQPRALHAWSMRSFHVAALSGDQVPLALPLIRATWPRADLASWRSFVDFFDHATNPSGVLVLRDSEGGICGVLAHRLDWDLQVGPMLAVHLFTAVDLANSLTTARALLEAANARALELGCVGIHIRLHNEQAELADRLRLLGLSSEGGLLSKKLGPAESPN